MALLIIRKIDSAIKKKEVDHIFLTSFHNTVKRAAVTDVSFITSVAAALFLRAITRAKM